MTSYRATALLVVSACTGADSSAPKSADAPSGPRTVTLSTADTLVALESNLIEAGGHVAVAANGVLYVSDYKASRLLRIDTSGIAAPIGRKGAGPGEFDAPGSIAATGDTLRVVDQGNGRVQMLTLDGQYVRSVPLAQAATTSNAGFAADGRTAIATGGPGATSLAAVYDANGRATGTMGELVTPAPAMWDMTAIKARIAEGGVPDIFRNMSLVRFAPDGGLWVILTAEAIVRRYDSAGTLRWAAPLEAPEMPAIKAAFFERNAAIKQPFGFAMLSYASDAVPVGDSLWVMLAVGDEEPSVVLALSPGGDLRTRFVIPALAGGRSFALDERRRRLYVSSPSSATVAAMDLP